MLGAGQARLLYYRGWRRRGLWPGCCLRLAARFGASQLRRDGAPYLRVYIQVLSQSLQINEEIFRGLVSLLSVFAQSFCHDLVEPFVSFIGQKRERGRVFL